MALLFKNIMQTDPLKSLKVTLGLFFLFVAFSAYPQQADVDLDTLFEEPTSDNEELKQVDAPFISSDFLQSDTSADNHKPIDSAIFQVCVFKVKNSDWESDSPLLDLCDAYFESQIERIKTSAEIQKHYFENQIDRMETTTEIQKYYLEIREEQKAKSSEIKWIVFSMVLVALILAVAQIGFGMFGKLNKDTSENTSEIEISFNRLKLTSSISGFILLIISFLFFYLYIANVYTIT